MSKEDIKEILNTWQNVFGTDMHRKKKTKPIKEDSVEEDPIDNRFDIIDL